MSLLTFAIIAQLSAPGTRTRPVLAFPEPGLDDSASYQGYQTRLFRDAAGNTVQIYIDARAGRVVHLWADADDESLGFTARDGRGHVAALRWNDAGAIVSGSSRPRMLEHKLIADAARVDFGWFLLGSMRVERDLQYAGRQSTAFDNAPFALPEIERMLRALHRLDPAERRRHLALLNAPDERTLRGRLQPVITTSSTRVLTVARVVQPAIDGRDTLILELRSDPRRVRTIVNGDSVSLRARFGTRVPFTVRIITGATALTPLDRGEIFNPQFLAFLDSTRAAGAGAAARSELATRARRLERQARGLELLSSHEKLMAGLPTYATYFGRDMLMTALMMRPIWRTTMSEFVVASALRKLSPSGQVSHEEALGGQAAREAASEYASLVDAFLRPGTGGANADSLRARAREVLRDLRRVRENYHMIDANFQFPIVAARWLTDSSVSAARKRTFLLDSADGGEPRLRRLVRELSLVADATAAYASDPIASHLISFAQRDSGKWASQSWRDSNVGYAGGRYAMDVNAIWAPCALESVSAILAALHGLGIAPGIHAETPLGRYARDPGLLRTAIAAWRGASRHFVVSLGPEEVRARVAARLAVMSPGERTYWKSVLARTNADGDSLTFLAIALGGDGKAIPVANSDPATRLFLGDDDNVLRDVRLFVRPYPAGLLVGGVGPVASNDSYAAPSVWRDFDRDRYHGPRVVWGREVNLFLLGAAARLADGAGSGVSMAYARELRSAIDSVSAAVEASGFHSELWSWEIKGGRAVPVRYGSGSDVQLWTTTDLAVAFALSRRP